MYLDNRACLPASKETMARFPENPLIRPGDVKPSQADLQVVGVCNAGCERLDDEILLLLRVVERPASGSDELVAPILDPEEPERGLQMVRVRRGDANLQEIDDRAFRYRGRTYQTSISHLRLAHSMDGRHFTVQERPAIFPATREEEYGIEDARIVLLGGEYCITYAAVSRKGTATALATTRDFQEYERRGIIFAPDDRDVAIFPEMLGGHYLCFHHPIAGPQSRLQVWAATSPDLLGWSNLGAVATGRPGTWDETGLASGAVPIRTSRGWLHVCNGTNHNGQCGIGVMLTDIEQPHRLLARSAEPVLAPQADYETHRHNTVFTCGAAAYADGRVLIYYGASEECICGAETTIDALLSSLSG